MKTSKKKITGTREWAAKTVNCIKGCSHNCKYCYARHEAVNRFKTMTITEWSKPKLISKEVTKNRGLSQGTIMFPSSHDILPEFLDSILSLLEKLLSPGNKVLIVSKPHVICIDQICKRFAAFRDQILFRFTIGALSNDVLSFWEPDAPSFEERMECLGRAYIDGFRTSISSEPLLDYDSVEELVERLDEFVTDSHWIGHLNKIDQRVMDLKPRDKERVDILRANQTEEATWSLFRRFRDRPKIRWKDSIKTIVGLKPAPRTGLDI